MTSVVGTGRAHLPALTGLRFVAALWVVAYHVLRPWLSAHDDPEAGAFGNVTRDLLAGAPVAVTIFFVLSGFVLTWMYAAQARAGGLDKRGFYAARLARLGPIYAIAVLVAVPLGAAARSRGLVDDGWASLAFVATGTQAWVPAAALQWNPPLWSVSVEVSFYLALPLLLPLVLRASPRALVVAAATAWALSLAAGVAYGALDPDGIVAREGHVRVESRGFWLHVLRFNPIVRAPDLLIGMVAARLFLDGARVPSAGPPRVAGAAAALAIGLGLASGQVPVPLLHGALFAPCAALLVVALATSTGPVARLLSTRAMQRLGEASYALYALHVPVWFWVAALTRTRLEDTTPQRALVVAVVALAVSLAAHALVERPLRERLRRRIARAAG